MPWIDEQIKDLMAKGGFSNLPGEGKPLKFEDDSHVPAHLRMAHKLLRDNDMAPEWIAAGKDVDAAREKLIADVRRAVRTYRGALNDAARSDQPEQRRAQVEKNWQQTLESLWEAVKGFNRQALSFNLKAPKGVTHKAMFDLDRELNAVR